MLCLKKMIQQGGDNQRISVLVFVYKYERESSGDHFR